MTKLGLFGLSFGARSSALVELASLAEDLGYDSLWFGEHIVLPDPQPPQSPLPPDLPILEPIVAFGAAAAVTTKIELATGIVILPQRNPVVLAKQVATLDAISGGRFTLGIGAGYLEPEMTAVGVSMRDRGRRTDEYLAAMRELWSTDRARFSGRYAAFADVTMSPRPQTGPRVVVGGHSEAAHRRALASAHGWYGWFLGDEQIMDHVARLRETGNRVDRDPALGALEIVVTPRGKVDPDRVEALGEAGVDHVVLLISSDLDVEGTREFMERHAQKPGIR